MSFVSIDQVTGQDQLKCTAFTNETWQPLRPAIAGNDPEPDFRLAELRVFRGDTNGAGHRCFTTASQGEAIHGCNYRLAKCLDEKEGLLAFLGELTCFLTVDGRKLSDIGTSNERLLSSSGQNDASDCGILLRRMKRSVEFFNGPPVERIHHLWAIQGDVTDRSLDLIRDVFEAGGYFYSTHETSPLD